MFIKLFRFSVFLIIKHQCYQDSPWSKKYEKFCKIENKKNKKTKKLVASY